MDTGSYRLQEEHCDLGYSARQWVKASKQKKERYLAKLDTFPLMSQKTRLLTSRQEDSSQQARQLSSGQGDSSQLARQLSSGQRDRLQEEITLSVPLSNTGLSTSIFGDMWKKAAKLVSDSTLMCNAPGLLNAKIVASHSGKPHTVIMHKMGRISCDCLNHVDKSLCAHALAVGEVTGKLQVLLSWYKSTGQSVNLWTLARSSGVPKYPGAKGGKPASNKRKGKAKLHIQSYSSTFPSPPMPAHQAGVSAANQLTADQVHPPFMQTFSSLPTQTQPFSPSASGFPLPNCGFAGSTFSPQSPYGIPYYPFHGMPMANTGYMGDYSPLMYAGSGFTCNSWLTSPRHFPAQAERKKFSVVFLDNRITTCYGCRQKFARRPSGQVLPLSLDLILKSKETREYYSKDGEKRENQNSNTYYHIDSKCVHLKHPTFVIETDLLIEGNVRDRLNDDHKALLSAVEVTINS